MRIEITTTDNGKLHWLSFPEVGNHNVSCHIDIHIFKNLNFEIDWAKKHFVYYENIAEIKEYCINLLKKGESIYEYENTINKEKENIKTQNKKTYLMKDNHNGFYKIGYSKNPKFREITLQSEKPSIKMVKTWDKNIESLLHKKYHNNRVRGEWFDLTKVQVKYICTYF